MRVTRTAVILSATALASVAVAAPASAHVIQVYHPVTGEQIDTHNGKNFQELKAELAEFGIYGGWVGAGGAAHWHGLIDACRATGSNSSAVTISAPWNDLNPCKHGGA